MRRDYNRPVVLWDLNGTLVHNNRSLGSGNLADEYGAGAPEALLQAYENGDLPKAYYLTSPDEVIWIDGALQALANLTKLGIENYIITNQEWINCGIASEEMWLATVNYMDDAVRAAGGGISSWYWCPHAPNEFCFCRKRRETPGLALFYKAAMEHEFCLPNAWMVGDNPSDIISGNMAGCRTIHIPLPHVEAKDRKAPATLTAQSLTHAVELIRSACYS